MIIHEKFPRETSAIIVITASIILAIILGFARTWYDGRLFDQNLNIRLQTMADAYEMAEVDARARDSFVYINENAKKIGIQSPLHQRLDESVWDWWIYFKNTLRNDLRGSDFKTRRSFYLMQKINSRQFQSMLDNPSAGTEAIAEILNEFTEIKLSNKTIKQSLTIKHRLRHIVNTQPSYDSLYPHALPVNCLTSLVITAPIMLLTTILIFGFRIHEDIVIPDTVSKLLQTPRHCSFKNYNLF